MLQPHIFEGVFIKVDDCYVAIAKDVPGAISEGRTLDEAQANLVDAIISILQAREKHKERKRREAEQAEQELSKLEHTYKEIIHRTVEIPV